MKEILLINPRQKKAKRRKLVKKGVVTMAKKKAGKRRKKTYRRKNPSGARRALSGVGGKLLSGLSIKTALKDQVPIQIGMFASKWFEKRFGGPEASDLDTESWNLASYAKGGLGALIAAIAVNTIKPGMGQKVLQGGLSQVVNRLIRNELITKSDWAVQQFGQGGEGMYVDEDGSPYMQGAGGEMLPLDESYRMLPEGGYGDSIVVPGPLGQIEPVGPLGSSVDFSRYAQEYRQ